MYSVTNNSKNTLRSGFTLVETLVAVTIFVIIILAPMAIASRGLQNAFYANEQATAIFLAQEAIEAVIRQRDDAALAVLYAGASEVRQWYVDMPEACKTATCGYDPAATNPNNEFIPCSTNNDCVLRILDVPGNGQEPDYRHSGGVGISSESIYRRKIHLEEIPSGSGNAKITVTVTWNANLFAGDRTITLQSWVMNQYDRFE